MEGLFYLALIIGAIFLASQVDKKSNYNTSSQPLQCMRCGNTNIQVSIMQYGQQGVSQTQKHKRSLADRTAYNASRGAMNMMTMGMWGVITPKRGKYKETTHTQQMILNQKVAICQYCGFSWNIK